MIGRRQFVAGLGSAVAWPVVARAQHRDRMRRVGVPMPYIERDTDARLSYFVQGWRSSVGSAVATFGWTFVGPPASLSSYSCTRTATWPVVAGRSRAAPSSSIRRPSPMSRPTSSNGEPRLPSRAQSGHSLRRSGTGRTLYPRQQVRAWALRQPALSFERPVPTVMDGVAWRGTGPMMDLANATQVPKGTFFIDHATKVHWDVAKDRRDGTGNQCPGPEKQWSLDGCSQTLTARVESTRCQGHHRIGREFCLVGR